MNMMFLLIGMCLFCGVAAVVVGLKNQREEERAGRRRRHVRAKVLHMLFVTGCLSIACVSAQAQEVVHAMTGDVSSVNAAAKTLTLKLDDGSLASFQKASAAASSTNLDKEMQAHTTAPAEFNHVGAHVVVFYYGFGDQRTAVAIKDLGTSPLNDKAGSVTDFDHHQHVVTVKGDTSGPQSFTLDEQTVVETPDGVIDGRRYHPNKGDHVTVVSGSAKGSTAALFIAAS